MSFDKKENDTGFVVPPTRSLYAIIRNISILSERRRFPDELESVYNAPAITLK